MPDPENASGFSCAEYDVFCQKIDRALLIRLSDYKPQQMFRRIVAMATQANAKSFEEFSSLIERDSGARKLFLRQVTINVTSLMRNPELFRILATEIVPQMAHKGPEPFRAWSAGCSNGAEALSAAIVLHDSFPSQGYSVLGTDIDQHILGNASGCVFSESDLGDLPLKDRGRFFETLDNGMRVPIASLRERVRFEFHDLLGVAYPSEAFDLILCRNVMIYFTETAKQRVFRRLMQALKPGGVLFLGCNELISLPERVGLELIRPFFYRRPYSAHLTQSHVS